MVKETIDDFKWVTDILAKQDPPTVYGKVTHVSRSGMMLYIDFYLAETSARLADINRLPAGERPAWEAEVPDGKPEIAKPEVLRQLLAEGLPLPLELYNDRDSAAIAAPTTAPASTSLG